MELKCNFKGFHIIIELYCYGGMRLTFRYLKDVKEHIWLPVS